MWILTEDHKRIIDTSSVAQFFISRSGKVFNVMHYRPGAINYSTLGTYSSENHAIIAIEGIFDALKTEETGHEMF